MSGLILYRDNEGELYKVSQSAFRDGIFDLGEKNLVKTDIKDLVKELAKLYGVHPEHLTVECFIPAISSDGKRKISVSYSEDPDLTETLRKEIGDYIESCVNPELSLKVFNIRETEKEFEITSAKHKDIMTHLNNIRKH